MDRRGLLLLLLLATACSTPSSASEPVAEPVPPVTAASSGMGIGAPLSDRVSVPLADILASPDRYQGQTVRTSGPVRAVCQHRGCWMDIGAEVEAEGRIHVRSLDHALAFPRDSIGKIAEVEGELQAMPGSSACGDADGAGCGMPAAGRRMQLAVRGVVIR